jgi:phosphatidylglycerol---prolipoprotein diacylglyceryl transferase
MFPLLRLGPFNVSSGGLLLVLALVVGSTLFERAARQRGGLALADQASRLGLPTIVGAVVGARLWYGLLNWDLYGRNPELFVALRIADLAWPGALLGGTLAAWLWCRLRRFDAPSLADAAPFGLLPAQLIACIGLLLSGEAFGIPTTLPWGISLFGATRHPTQLYLAVAAVAGYALFWRLARRPSVAGALFAIYLGWQGLILLLLEPLRADSLLLPGGVRAAQVVGLGLLLAALVWLRGRGQPAPAGEGGTVKPSGSGA